MLGIDHGVVWQWGACVSQLSFGPFSCPFLPPRAACRDIVINLAARGRSDEYGLDVHGGGVLSAPVAVRRYRFPVAGRPQFELDGCNLDRDSRLHNKWVKRLQGIVYRAQNVHDE